MDTATARRPGEEATPEPSTDRVELRAPGIDDGLAVHALVRSCAPLDENSAYCNLLQCTHFAATCVVAERGRELLGWVSAYRPPEEPDVLFVWQVAVHAKARGLGLGGRLLDALMARPACAGVRVLKTTITDDNAASWGLFKRFAAGRQVPLERTSWLIEGPHLPAGHATENLVAIGPFPTRP